MKDLKSIYNAKKNRIKQRLAEFSAVWRKKDEKAVFEELAFCLLTPQSKAKACWEAVCGMKKDGILHKGTEKQVRFYIRNVRFKNKKAQYICLARDYFKNNGSYDICARLGSFKSPYEAREWLAGSIKGMGYKEASHFLRNIGLGRGLAILDRHILKNLKKLGVIRTIPPSVTRKTYLDMEKRMLEFSQKMRIPAERLDLLFWSEETGEIFK